MVLVGLVVGIALLWVSSHSEWLKPNSPWQAVVSQAGGLIIATAVLALAWEVIGRRTFAAELLAKARLSADITKAGITRVTDQYIGEVQWADLFQGVNKLDLVLAYGRTWRNTHRARLEEVAARKGSRIRVYLPDPDDPDTVRVLADRFSTTSEKLQENIREAIEDFGSLSRPGGGVVEVYTRAGDAVFSCYRFDGQVVLTLYSHARKRRTRVPTFVVRGGDLFQFVYEEIHDIREQSSKVN